MRRRHFLMGLATALVPTKLLAKDTGNYWGNHSPEAREWLRSVKPPSAEGTPNAAHCCDEADGKPCAEDIKDGNYLAMLPVECYTDERAYNEPKVPYFKPVPERVIIRPNKIGEPVAWITYTDGKIVFRCYSPGGGV